VFQSHTREYVCNVVTMQLGAPKRVPVAG
jgi:hypothetical protein